MRRLAFSFVLALALHAVLALALPRLLSARTEPVSTEADAPALVLARVDHSFAPAENEAAPVRTVSATSIMRPAPRPPAPRPPLEMLRGDLPMPQPEPTPEAPAAVPDTAPRVDPPALPEAPASDSDTASEPPVPMDTAAPETAHVEAPPALVTTFRPRYPDAARRRGEEGTVVLEIAVDAQGNVTGATVATSSGSSALDSAARAAASKLKFTPASRNGAPVGGTVRIPFAFRLRD